MLCVDANKYAPPAKLVMHDEYVAFEGYQGYILMKNSLFLSSNDLIMKQKQNLLEPYFKSKYFAGRTVLDLGANAGFHSFWAIQSDAEEVTAIDIDDNYLRMLEDAKNKLGFDNLKVEKENVMNWNEPSDIVLAFALVHWLYSCTALFGSLDNIIKKFRQLTRYMLIVEWISPEDEAINFFHHLDWNKSIIQDQYTLSAFETALANHFKEYKLIGNISPTRSLYIAFCSPKEIDLSGPLPIIMNKEFIIYSRFLSEYRGVEYWSRIYDHGDMIYKQATLDLAEREGYFLSQIECDYFPKVLESRSERTYSLITLEKIQGKALDEALSDINDTPYKLNDFIQHCLNIIIILKQKGIVHRDIRSDNILVRNGKPVLIDFGWAISSERPCITPPGLGSSERPDDGSFCDVYSMGKVFQKVNKQKIPGFDSVIGLMTEPDASLRVVDIRILKALFSSLIP